MEATTAGGRGAPKPHGRARGAARANLGGAFGQVWATFGAPGSVLLTLFMQEWLGAAKWQIGLVLTMTYLGPTFEPAGAFLAEKLGRRRLIFLITHLINRTTFLLLAFIPFLGTSEGQRSLGIALVLLVVGGTRVAAHLGSPAWWSWMGDLVPDRRRGRFFGCRSQWNSFATAASFILGMTLLHYCGGMSNTYLVSILFTVGALFGMADILLYLGVPEPPLSRRGDTATRRHGDDEQLDCSPRPRVSVSPRLQDFLAPFRSPGYRRLILGMGLWSFSANLVLPFLPVFQRGEVLGGSQVGLGISWLFLAVLNVATNLAAMLTSRWWAGWSCRFGARSLLLVGSGHLFVNVLYFLAVPGRCAALLVIGAILTGAFTAAWTVSTNQFLLGVAPRENRSFYVSAYNFTNGWLMAGGPLLGGLLADRLPVLGGHLPSGLPWCYFHLLLALALFGGAAALVVLSGVPAPEGERTGPSLPSLRRVVWTRVHVVWDSIRWTRRSAVLASAPTGSLDDSPVDKSKRFTIVMQEEATISPSPAQAA